MTNKYFEVERITNGASGEKRLTKTFRDEEKAIAYAKRYNRTTKTIYSVKTTVHYTNGTDTGILYKADTNGFEKDYRVKTNETETTSINDCAENKKEEKYNFSVDDYTEKRELPIVYGDYTKKEIVKYFTDLANKNNHTYKIFICDRNSDKALVGRIFYKVINWQKKYEVGKTGSRIHLDKFSLYEKAEKYCKEEAKKDNVPYTIYEIKLDEYGRDEPVPVTNIEPEPNKPETAEPTEKVVGYRVGLGGKIYKTEAEAFANNPKDAKQVFKVVDNGDGLTWEYVPIDKPKENDIKTLHEWEEKGGNFTDFCKVGDKVDKGIVDYFLDVLPPITWRSNLVQCGEPYGHRDNPETGRWEAMYITFAKNDNGQWCYAGICFLNQRKAIA